MDPRSESEEFEHHIRGGFGPRRGPGRRGRGGMGFGGGMGGGMGFGPESPMHRGPRRGRGDVRTAALLLLRERPMHGYEMIQEIRERSGGAWSPSPGAIYPTIQLLTDEGLITTHDEDGKKVSSLTESGRQAADELAATKAAPWDEASTDAGEGAHSLRQSIHHLMMAVKQVAIAGSDAQRQRATELLDETRRKIYGLLASDDA